MSLYEQFWSNSDEKQGRGAMLQPGLSPTLTAMQPTDSPGSEAARDLGTVAKRGVKRYPPVVISQPQFSARPVCLLYTVSKGRLPHFHELFEQYLDKNGFIAEVFLRLVPHVDMPFVLFLGPDHFYLYDLASEELLRWGTDFESLQECLLAPLDAGEDLAEKWGRIRRKTINQRGEEFIRWLDLWKAAVGARTGASAHFMLGVMQKVILLFQFDSIFGLGDPDLNLRINFLELRRQGAKAESDTSPSVNFDGNAWLHEASREVCDRLHLDFLFWTQAESSFFSLMGADAQRLFSQFILELFLISRSKFLPEVQCDAFSDPTSRLKLWKYSVTESLDIERRLPADEVNVYEPLSIDLEESGVGWTLHLAEETMQFWRRRCENYARELADRRRMAVQFDFFQQSDPENARLPGLNEVFETAFTTSLKIYYESPLLRSNLEYLIILQVLEMCREHNLPLQPLDGLGAMFVRKESLAKVQDI